MIVEYLQPDPSIWDGLTVVIRAGYYAATLGAAGLVFALVAFGDTLDAGEVRRVRGYIVLAVVAGIALSLLAFGVRAVVLSKDGFAGLLRTDLYPVIARSRIGDAASIRLGGLVLLLAALSTRPWALPVAAVGAVMVCASYAAMGHSTLYRPRQELTALVVVHLVAVSFWIGSLPVLRLVADRPAGPGAAAPLEAFSRIAVVVVPLLVAIGLVGAWYLVGRFDLLVASWYGWGMIAKVALVAVMLGFGVLHRSRLVPDCAAGQMGAQARLRSSLGWEIVVALLVLYAAAEMVSVHPIDYGHRVPA
jgi:putative copper export protein